MNVQIENKVQGDNSVAAPSDFSLILGGPLYRLLRGTHLSDEGFGLLRRRIITISMIAWLPLLLFSLVEGSTLSAGIAIPFLLDIETHSRFLIALPLLIYAELLVHTRM